MERGSEKRREWRCGWHRGGTWAIASARPVTLRVVPSRLASAAVCVYVTEVSGVRGVSLTGRHDHWSVAQSPLSCRRHSGPAYVQSTTPRSTVHGPSQGPPAHYLRSCTPSLSLALTTLSTSKGLSHHHPQPSHTDRTISLRLPPPINLLYVGGSACVRGRRVRLHYTFHLQRRQDAARLACGHELCAGCLEQHLNTSCNASCPCCRQAVPLASSAATSTRSRVIAAGSPSA